MPFSRMQVKKLVLNNQVFTVINDNPSPYNNYYWHHVKIIHKNFILVEIQSPSRKLLYEALKRSLITCMYAEEWYETIRIDMRLSNTQEVEI